MQSSGPISDEEHEMLLIEAERLMESESDLKVKNKELGIVVDDLSRKLLVTKSGYDRYVRILTAQVQSMQSANDERLRRLEKLLEERILKELESRVSRIQDANDSVKEVVRKTMTEAVEASFGTITATANGFNTTTEEVLKGLVATGKKAGSVINRSAAGWVPKAILGVFVLILAGIGWSIWENEDPNGAVQQTRNAVFQMYAVQGTKEKYLALHPEFRAPEPAPIVEPKKP